ncbi:MAG: glutaredoxin domain-containing protein [Nanoarchaeota archaeon]|nr:glutaredoxin domain-containing protein [Nanoarchaeota archaeon]
MVVKVYSTKVCPWCVKAKEFLREKNVEFENVFVDEDAKARNEMFDKTGQLGVPAIEIGDTILVGYNIQHITDALKKANLI